MSQITRGASLAFILLSLVVSPPPSLGEGCKAGKRPLSVAEQTFFARLTDVQAYMPEPPDGWRVVDTKVDGPDSLCSDSDPAYQSGKQALTGSVSVTYERTQSPPAEQKKAAEASRAQILVSVNADARSYPLITAQPLAIVGAPSAIRLVGKAEALAGESRVPVSGTTLILLGPWKTSTKEGHFDASPTPPANPLYTRLQNMVLELRADPGMAAELLKEINVQALGGMLAAK